MSFLFLTSQGFLLLSFLFFALLTAYFVRQRFGNTAKGSPSIVASVIETAS
jgi:hypothetical protein